MDEEIGLRLSLKNRRETVAGLDDVGDKLDRAGDEAVALGRKSRIGAAGVVALGKSGRIAGRAMVYGFGAASAAVVGAGIALTKLAKDSVGEARESQKVGAITRREIKATGQAANVTAKQVGRLAGAISEKVGVDDEEIQSGANMILTFKNVRNEVGRGSKIFNRATQAAVDLAKAGFGSITSQSKVLAKALNDPVKGLSALGRSGVTFTQDQQDRIKYLAEHNDLLGAQKIMLTEVESQVGGVAAAQATWGEKASVSIGNIKESIGNALLPMLDRTEKWFVQKGAPVLEDWVGIFEKRGIPTIEKYADVFADKAVPAIGDFLDDARPLAKSVIPAIGTGASTIADAFKVIAPRAKQVFDGFNNLPDWAKTGISLGVLGGAAAKKLGAFDRGSVLGSIASYAKPLPVIVTNPGFGAPGLSGGKPGAAPLPGGKPPVPGIPGGFLGALGLTAGVTLASSGEHAGDRANAHLMPQMDWDVYLKERKDAQIKAARETADALDRLLVRPLGRVKDLNDQFDFLGVKRPTPKITTPGMDEAIDSGDRLFGILGAIDRKQVAPKVYLDGIGTAEARLDSFRSKLSQLGAMDASPGVGLSVLSAPRREHGGPVRANRPYVVGERRPELFIPKVDGKILPRLPARELAMPGAPAAPEPIHVHLHVDGREMAEVVVDRLSTVTARK